MAHKTTHHVWRDGRLYARITYVDSKGKRQQKTKRVESDQLRDVEETVRNLRNDLEEGGPNTFIESRTALGVFLDQWREITKGSRSEKTDADYETLIRLYIKPSLGGIELGKLSKMEVQALYCRLLERGLSSRTVRYTHAVLSVALKQAVAWDKLKRNPIVGVKLPKKQTREMQPLDESQVKLFLAECGKDKKGLILEFALYTGARPEEYLGLQWKDIDFERATVTIQRTLRYNRRGGGWYFGEPKTVKSRRSFPLDEPLLLALRRHKVDQWQMTQDRFEKNRPYERLGLVFASELGTPLSVRNLQRDSFKPILKRAKLPDIRLYDLRHTCATLLLLTGTDIKTVSEWLGHANPDETLRTYAHVLPSMRAQAGKNIALAMRGAGIEAACSR
jgi:integrase